MSILLIKRLYDPSSSKVEIDAIQKELQQAQRAPEGWELANQLLAHEDQNVRFFGALTYTVKINQEGSTIVEKDLLPLLNELLNWLQHLTNQGDGQLVIRKLCSTLATFFVLPNAPWHLCVRHIVQCISTGHVVSESTREHEASLLSLLHTLNAIQFRTVLLFVNTLAEDVIRVDRNSQRLSEVHQRVEANVADVSVILKLILQRPQEQNIERVLALQCYQAWVTYAREQMSDSSDKLQPLRELLGLAMECLVSDDTYEAAAEFFTDMFINGDKLLTKESLDHFSNTVLQSRWAHAYFMKFQIREIDDDVSIFGQLVLAFGQHVCGTLVTTPHESLYLLNIMHEITKLPNFDTVDQALSNAIVDFWEEYASQATTSLQEESTTSALYQIAKQQWLQAVEELCISSRLPFTGQDFKPLGGDTSLSEFRHRVKDAIHSSYDEFGIVVLQKLIYMALHVHAGQTGQLAHTDGAVLSTCTLSMEAVSLLESIFNCLEGLSDSMHYHSSDAPMVEEDATIQGLFDSSLYVDLTNLDIAIPSKLRKRVIRVLGEHVKVLGRNTARLLHAIDILLKCLALPDIMEVTALAISRLCDGNRNILVSRLDLFLDVSEQFFAYSGSEQDSRIYIARAVASIVEATSPSAQQGLATQRLLSMIERSYTTEVAIADGDPEAASLNALEQLVGIGKAFQQPEDGPINLDEEKLHSSSASSYWTQSPGLHIQSQIVQFLLTLFTPFRASGTVLEAVCNVIKTGYRETNPGPFVFQPSITIDILTSIPPANNRLDVAISTAASFVSSHNAVSAFTSTDITQANFNLLTHICLIIIHLGTPSIDPEISHATVDFLTRLLPTNAQLFTSLPPETLQTTFSFTLLCLSGPDIMPKRSSASFWSAILPASPSSGASSDFTNSVIEAFGPSLVRILIQAIGGKAARSELDMLSEPLRRLIAAFPAVVKLWMEQALTDDEVFPPSERVDDAAKRRFVAQLVALRGAGRTRAVVKEFWTTCRGAPVGY